MAHGAGRGRLPRVAAQAALRSRPRGFVARHELATKWPRHFVAVRVTRECFRLVSVASRWSGVCCVCARGIGMKEDRDMFTARASREPGGSSDAVTTELSTLPTDALARLDRLATASVLASGLAHEIANPLSCLLGAIDA